MKAARSTSLWAALGTMTMTMLWGKAEAGCKVGPATCYHDYTEPSLIRIMGEPVAAALLTKEYCAQLCHNRKMPLAGVEQGTQCMCGSGVKNGTHAATEFPGGCTATCRGSRPWEKGCGGNFALSVYGFNCSGAPVPPPSPPPPPAPPAPPCTEFNQANCSELYNPCLNASAPYHAMPFCDATLPLDARVADMIARMTTAEKIASLDNGSPAIVGLGTHPYNWWSEASSGVANEVERRGKGTQTTKFAFPITTGMSFNRTLWQVTGRQIGREARAMMNVGTAYSTFWAPVINLAREPRWGRNIETPGEDPYLTGEYSVFFTHGMQEAPEDPGHIQASACCKHFIANSLEGTTERDGEEEDRMHVNSNVTLQDLIDSYMAPFQTCVEKGRVTGLMCSYNAVNGVPSCANDWLLTDIARGEWGFDGYVTSDCDADALVSTTHHYADTAEEAVRDVLRAGTDNDCGGFVGKNAASALNKSVITEHDIDQRLAMLWKVRLRLGHFDPLGPLDELKPEDTICTEYAIEASMQGMIQSAALLKNDGGALPLSAKAAGSVAVIGPNANYSWGDTGYYGPKNLCGRNYWTAFDAVKKYNTAGTTVMVPGIPSAMDGATSGIKDAVAAAKSNDTVVLVVGTDLKGASEGHDATNLTFTDAQALLIEQVTAVAKKPIIVIVMTATPLDLSGLLANPKVGAILHVGQPSVTVLGVAEILYGNVSPAGRTIQTIYPKAYQDQISIFDFNMRPGPSAFARPDCATKEAACPRGTNPGRTYKFYTGKAVVPFGFGLSYTTFAYKVSASTITASLAPVRGLLAATAKAGRTFPSTSLVDAAAPLVEYSINVTNTGRVDADDVVLGFLTPPGAGTHGVPLSLLFGFERVHVKAGETKTVFLYPSLTDFTQVGVGGDRRVVSGDYTASFGVKETADKGMGFDQHAITMV